MTSDLLQNIRADSITLTSLMKSPEESKDLHQVYIQFEILHNLEVG